MHFAGDAYVRWFINSEPGAALKNAQSVNGLLSKCYTFDFFFDFFCSFHYFFRIRVIPVAVRVAEVIFISAAVIQIGVLFYLLFGKILCQFLSVFSAVF